MTDAPHNTWQRSMGEGRNHPVFGLWNLCYWYQYGKGKGRTLYVLQLMDNPNWYVLHGWGQAELGPPFTTAEEGMAFAEATLRLLHPEVTE